MMHYAARQFLPTSSDIIFDQDFMRFQFLINYAYKS
jgi:hypothetical protein